MLPQTTEAVVGLERTFYQVNEDVGEVQVCVSVPSPDISCPVTYPFTVVLATVAESAGKHVDFSVAWVKMWLSCYFHYQEKSQIMNESFMW